jgi:uncharacterized protein YciI
MAASETVESADLYVYRLIPPRPSFAADADPDERAVMDRHVAYWSRLMAEGSVLVFGPVADPTGGWGMAVVHARSADEVRAFGAADPAVTSGVATFEVAPMPMAVLPASVAAGLRFVGGSPA